MSTGPKRLPTIRDTSSLFERDTREVLRRVWDDVDALSATLAALDTSVGSIVAGVSSVTAGSPAVVVTPTTGAVVVDVNEAGFSGIPQAAVTNLVSDLLAITTDITTIQGDIAALVADDLLDIDSVTAGTNLSGGGASGDVTLNVVASPTFAGTVTAAGFVHSGFTAGSVVFVGPGGALAQDNANFFWDDTDNCLALRQNTVDTSFALNVNGGTSGGNIRLNSASNIVNAQLAYYDSAGTRRGELTYANSAALSVDSRNKLFVHHDTGTTFAVMGNTIVSPRWDLVVDGSTGSVALGKITPTANIVLDVYGTAMVNQLGTTRPTFEGGGGAQLTVTQAGGNWGIANVRATNDASGPHFTLLKTRATDPGTRTAVQNGDTLGNINFTGVDSATAAILPCAISAVVNGAVGSGSIPTDLQFKPGTGTGPTVKLTLGSDGKVQLGNSSTAAVSAASTGALRFSSSNRLQVSENTGTYVNLTREDRTISTSSPITGGGDLSANRTLAFDQSVALNNNARVAVSKNSGAVVGNRRELNFIEGTNIALTIADDAANEEIDITIAVSGLAAIATSGSASDLVAGTVPAARMPALTGDVTTTVGTVATTITADAVTDTKLRNSVGVSVIGRSLNSVGDPADIVAGSDGHILRRAGGVLGFGTIPQSSVDGLTTALAGKVGGTGTVNYLAKFTDVDDIGDSGVVDDGSVVYTGRELQVQGTAVTTHINYRGSANEDTYIRAGKVTGAVYIGDNNTGGINLGSASNTIYTLGSLIGAGISATTLSNAAGSTSLFTLTVNSAATFNSSVAFTGGLSISATGTIEDSNTTLLLMQNAGGVQIGDTGTDHPLRVYGTATIENDLVVSGNATLGNLNVTTLDTHTVYGATTVDLRRTTASTALNVAVTPQGPATGSQSGVVSTIQAGAGYDTTAGALTTIAVQGTSAAIRGGGANNLTNIGGNFGASGGQVNIALRTLDGNVELNTAGGTTTISGATTITTTLAVNGNVTLGDAAGDSHTVNGTLTCVNAVSIQGNATIGNAAGDAHTVNGTLTCVNGVTCQSTLAINGNATIGDASSDTHTLNGNLTFSNTPTAGPVKYGSANARLFLGRRIFTTVNSGTAYTPTTGTKAVLIRMVGAGGGGGGTTGVAAQAAAGAGGGSGAYLEKWIDGASTVTSTGNMTITAGGTAGANTGGTGGTGGDTVLNINGTTYTAKGGTGGVGMVAGTGLAVSTGGVVASGSSSADFESGDAGANGIRLSASVGVPGAGGSNPLGVGGGAPGIAAGITGRGYGAGGGGSFSFGTAYTGGAGAPGVIIIDEYA